ncbi:MAG: pyridine nucleotide-disulfide oxidoreductase [Alphaproteobacteria bacterium HGW-Alphaproteobacteria-13]|nr:MAG: pyridine nucleotide-disulfide oxidoreductase [Alphaproteobacteria bacterium HGW-Alphaproteobacteria-13]
MDWLPCGQRQSPRSQGSRQAPRSVRHPAARRTQQAWRSHHSGRVSGQSLPPPAKQGRGGVTRGPAALPRPPYWKDSRPVVPWTRSQQECETGSISDEFLRNACKVRPAITTSPNGHRTTGPNMKKRVILAGGGHAHLAVLADWAARPLDNTERWLVTSSRHTAYSGMLPGWLAGVYRANELLIDLKPLVEKAGARLVISDVVGLDVVAKTLSLSSGDEIGFDLLSLATGGETDISNLATLRDRLLPVRPVGTFMERWSTFMERTVLTNTVGIAVAGGGAAGVELALGAETAIRRFFRNARVSLVTPREGFLSGHAPQARTRALDELAKRKIDLHFAQAAGTEGGLLLSNGHFLPADCVIAATGSRAPRWLARSGLACNENGFVAVGADMRSSSHDFVLAAGDIIDRIDRNLERSGVHAVKAGPVLAANLRAVVGGTELRQYQPRRRTLYLLALGDKRAILSWGRIVAIGNWVWRIKDWIDRSFVGRYTDPVRHG